MAGDSQDRQREGLEEQVKGTGGEQLGRHPNRTDLVIFSMEPQRMELDMGSQGFSIRKARSGFSALLSTPGGQARPALSLCGTETWILFSVCVHFCFSDLGADIPTCQESRHQVLISGDGWLLSEDHY